MIKGVLTIIFDEPFYKAIFEQFDGTEYKVAQVNMGTSLPTMPKIINLVNEHYSDLRFSKSTLDQEVMHHINSKRAQRLAHKEVRKRGIGTKAQQALKKQFEKSKITRKKMNKDKKREMQKERFLQKQIKRRKKHRGH